MNPPSYLHFYFYVYFNKYFANYECEFWHGKHVIFVNWKYKFENFGLFDFNKNLNFLKINATILKTKFFILFFLYMIT